MSSKYDGFSYGQLYAHYDSVLQLSQSVTATSARAAELQRELGQIRMALHAKAQERIDKWNGTPAAKDTVCDHTQREPNSRSSAEPANVETPTRRPSAARSRSAAPATTAAKRKSPKPRSELARSLPRKKSHAPKRCASARRAESTTKGATARARSKRQ